MVYLPITEVGGHAVAVAWVAGNVDNQGVMDSSSTGNFTGNGWVSEQCTFITVDHGPFDNNWMYTWAPFGSVVPPVLSITLGPDAAGLFIEAMVLGAFDQVIGSGMKQLAVCLPMGGAVPANYVGAGKRYLIDGKLRVHDVAQCGEWAVDATPVAGTTVFEVSPYAALTDYMVGWHVQPNVNYQVYAPITAVDPQQNTVTVAGNYGGIASTASGSAARLL
jgi:hypothetical protein